MESSKTIIRRLLPAAAALALFFVVSAVYFAPQFRGEVLPQHDVVQYDGMAKDINDMREATGEDPQWTGRMFGGMPAYLINVAYPAQLVKNTLGRVVKIIDTPAAFLFFAMTAMWLMLLIFGVNPWVGVVASLAYGLSTYFLLIIGAGHITKMWALVYAPLMMGGAWMTLRGNMWAGGALTALLGAVMLLDLVPVDLRFLSHDDFISARRRQITATAADKAILADKDPGFRVLNLTVSPFQDATTSYFHRSVGGYHGAKLARYQDLIDRYLSYRNDAVLDMLNTRYLIVPGDDGQPQAVRRATANGPAWFVDGIVAADTPQQEIDLLGSVDLKTTAVAAPADKAFAEEWQAGGQADTTLVRGIALTEYRPNYQKYEYTAPEESVAVFSEIFYDHGWTAYVDGEAMPGFRADYILRAMKLPAGRHTVEWRFRAPGWAAAEAVTLVSSLLILLGAAAALTYCFRKKKA